MEWKECGEAGIGIEVIDSAAELSFLLFFRRLPTCRRE
jgi:hypothetical protein